MEQNPLSKFKITSQVIHKIFNKTLLQQRSFWKVKINLQNKNKKVYLQVLKKNQIEIKSNKYFEKNQSSKCYKIILKSQQFVYLFIY
ncbi:unnamed protein product [Paramecium primaurelia]|uniref:Uncharacterized protein n=1 Tax=Paramecium primaurelia TaxID=5886 RepID=A0A8S1L148_PARPR|nr:unnamed protein product [Paramecium primaurelia]